MPSSPDPGRIEWLVGELVAIPTHEREQEAQELLAEHLSAAGFACALQAIEPGRPNLVASRGVGGPFVCSHVDAHPPHAHPNPFTCRRDGEFLLGRGALDAKGQIAALVAAVEAVPDAPATVVITCDEEGRGKGSELLELDDVLRPEGGGVVLEPTAFHICAAQAGAIELRVRARTEGSHAYARDGVSALGVLDGTLDALRSCSFLQLRDPRLPAPQLHVTVLRAGEHPWRTPAAATVECALDLVGDCELATAVAEIEDVAETAGRAWAARGATVEAEVVDVSEPVGVRDDLPVVGRLQRAAGTPLPFGGMPSWTDAGNLLVHHAIPCVVFGAGELTSAHSDRERVRLDDLVRLAEILAAFVAA